VKQDTVTAIHAALEADPSLPDGQRLSILKLCGDDEGSTGDGAPAWSGRGSPREAALDRVFARPLWDEHDLATVLDAAIDTIRHMKSRHEIPGVVQINQRCWRVHRDAFLEHFKQIGMPRRRGRPRKGSAEPKSP
jgi:hypothetical protein